MKIHYSGALGGPYGWGVCGLNLTRELGKHAQMSNAGEADVIFTPICDHDLNPALVVPGKVNMGYTFFESPLGPNAAQNAARYDIIFAGSTWCMERLAERGITNTKLLIQGVDSDIFSPQPPRPIDGSFRVFSGGKFEYRKGQDLVIAAFREFVKTHPEAHLVCSWFNPWPQLIEAAVGTGSIRWPIFLKTVETQEEYFTRLLLDNWIPERNFTICPQLSQRELAKVMAATDCGLFPNRCEGGTNLVLMEYAAVGRQVVANTLTGHADVEESVDVHILACEDENRWAIQTIPCILDSLKHAYKLREEHITPFAWPWSEPARIVLQTARELLQAKA